MSRARLAIAVVLVACVAGLLWMFGGPVVADRVVDRANVIGGVAGVVALAVSVAVLWPRRRRTSGPAGPDQVAAAVEYLAGETLRYWRVQAHDRRISTPSPAAVRWSWAGGEVAVPARGLRPIERGAARGVAGALGEVLTAGVVTRLREQLYERLLPDRGRLVMLGDAGAGKTAALLLLLIDALEHRGAGSEQQPVPVWLTLGGWNPTSMPLLDWAAATLVRDYPGLAAAEYGGPATAAELIRRGRVALFLDGLDEMPPAVQGRALDAIDRDAAGMPVVLTSRPQEYSVAVEEGRLYGAAVVELLPVDIDQAARFLLAEQLEPQRRRWQHVLDRLRAEPDSVAARTLTTPLALSLARDTYVRDDPAELLDLHATPDALLQHLLRRFLDHAYPDVAERRRAVRWLSWIARRMDSSPDLKWWDIPGWSPRRHLALVVGVPAGAAGLAFGLWVGFASAPKPVAALLYSAVGLILGGFYGSGADFGGEPHRLNLRWPTPAELLDVLGIMLVIGLAMGLLGGLAGWAGLTGVGGLKSALLLGPTVAVAFGPGFGLAHPLSTPLAGARAATPVEVQRSDRRRNLAFGVAFGLTVSLGLALLVVLAEVLVADIRVSARVLVLDLGVACTIGLAFGLLLGLGPALRLHTAELAWLLCGQRVRYMPLLETALDRQVLRQAGTAYQFRHAALQDLLAADTTADPPSVERSTRDPADDAQAPR